METVERDYTPKGVQFYYLYKQLAHPELSNYIDPFDLPAFFGPVITGEQRQLKFVVRLRVLPGQREPALPTSAFRHPSQP